jgi:uncharacterized protein YgbK (DUF1537 family)
MSWGRTLSTMNGSEGSRAPMQILAIADDTTGALEVGGQLAGQRVRALVSLRRKLGRGAEALVVDAQTRHLTAAAARDRVARLGHAAREARIPHLYKKTDSTLRGNIAAEFQALLDAFPERPLVYVPAYPKMGRTVRGGELFVDGRPLAETAIARDPLNPAREGFIPKLLARGCGAPVHAAGTASQLRALLDDDTRGSVLVCDGTTDDDLREIASVLASLRQPCLVAGTGGFVGEWAGLLPVERSYQAPRLHVERCLVISGSLHPASREQVRRAASDGVASAYLGGEPGSDTALAQQLAEALRTRGWAALATPGTCPPGVGVRVGALARQAVRSAAVDCLVIFGGDTALTVLRSIGATVLESVGELTPGVPLSLARDRGRTLLVASKAGGFGGTDMLLSIKELLEKRR